MPLSVIRSLSQQGLLVRESSKVVTEMPDENEGQKEHFDSRESNPSWLVGGPLGAGSSHVRAVPPTGLLVRTYRI